MKRYGGKGMYYEVALPVSPNAPLGVRYLPVELFKVVWQELSKGKAEGVSTLDQLKYFFPDAFDWSIEEREVYLEKGQSWYK